MKYNVKRLTFTVMLSAMAIIIPLIMPKIIIGPASFTLGSHVPIFIAMFLGWDVALMVGISSGLGFFLSLGPIIAARAFSHLLWAIPGSLILKKISKNRNKLFIRISINVIIAFFHALFESIVVSLFFMENLNDINFILTSIILPIGLGGFVHSLIDFEISLFIFNRTESHINLSL